MLLAIALIPDCLKAVEVAKDFRIKVVVIDSLSKKPVEFATLSVTKKGDSTPVRYALTDASGWAEITGLTEGDYKVKTEFLGYQPLEIEISSMGQRLVDLGKIYLKEAVNTLDAVVVSAMGNPIIVKKDTLEYNASSFKTTDSDMLEELLKKLPGIEIDTDGNITVNGKVINKVMIDGKPFFLDDPQLATKNLPARIIDKVKVVDRKSEQARFTGIDDGEEETVIDLSIRPGMMNGWFGNMTGGYGTDERFQFAGMAGNFTDKSQLSILANANNTNNRGFFDIAGSMMRSMRSSMGGGFSGRGGVRIGGSVMNWGGNGITTSWMGGLNGSSESENKKLKITGSYLYTGSGTVSETERYRQNFLQDSSFNNIQKNYSDNNSNGHRAGIELEYQLSELTSVLFRPNVNFNRGDFMERNEYNTVGSSGTFINEGISESFGNNNSQNISGDLLFRQKFNKTGRTFSVNFTYGYGNNEIDAYNRSTTDLYGEDPYTEVIDQKYNVKQSNYNLGGRLTYTEPLGNKFFMELGYSYSFRKNYSDKESFNYNTLTERYDIRDTLYSNYFENTFINQRAEVNVRRVTDKFNYSVGINVQPSVTISTGDREISRNVVNYSPTAFFEYDFSDNESMRIRYRGITNQPSISQLQPVPDNSNPLYLPLGNPDLLPEFEHNLQIRYRKSVKGSFKTTEVRAEGRYTMDKIVNKTWYESGGVQKSMPVNENGVYSLSANLMHSTPIAKSKFFVMSDTRGGLNKGANYSNNIRNLTTSLHVSERLRLTYRGDKLEASAGGSAAYSYAWYTIEQQNKPATWSNSVNMNINWSLPAGFNLISDFDYRFYMGYNSDFNEPVKVWNAEISKQLLKNSATVRLKVYDILNQSKNINRTTTDNYIEDTRTNTLRQYFLLSFTWRFGSFGENGKEGSGQGHRGSSPPPGGFRRF
ncbi:MAG: TonB-dependent receptor family protein [Bacteroidales bacterium]|nr:TonB-dependent receptor family protein [Bacteroidales bacterium]